MRTRVGAAILREGKMLLIRRLKNGREYYVLPGGGVEEGETPLQALIREVEEETSLSFTQSAVVLETEDRQKHIIFVITDATGTPMLAGPEKQRESAENVYAFAWIPVDDLAGLELFPEAARRLKEYLA
jgi:8-oxo-dGTP diphosphatase